jgi:hypothetical protein
VEGCRAVAPSGEPGEAEAAVDDPGDNSASEHAPGAAFAHAVRLTPEHLVVPPDCACCGGLASRSVLAARFASKARILVPYCAVCHSHVSRAKTRALSATVASALLAVTVWLGLPLIWQPPSVFVYAFLAACASALPLVALRLRSEKPAPGHSASGHAALWGPGGALLCSSGAWAARLSAASRAAVVRVRAREPAGPAWAVAFPIAAALGAALLYGMHFPRVRIVNVTGNRLAVAVDDRVRVQVEPTSAESATAGVSLRFPAGQHRLTATDPAGRVVDDAAVFVQAGAEHLYAPASGEVCFWTEVTTYGRLKAPASPPEPLPRSRTFWVLPGAIDYWFAPSPRPEEDDRSSGGLSVALRQAPCDSLPRR